MEGTLTPGEARKQRRDLRRAIRRRETSALPEARIQPLSPSTPHPTCVIAIILHFAPSKKLRGQSLRQYRHTLHQHGRSASRLFTQTSDSTSPPRTTTRVPTPRTRQWRICLSRSQTSDKHKANPQPHPGGTNFARAISTQTHAWLRWDGSCVPRRGH